MAKFAIVRQDGEVDTADGVSVDDIASRYGWPGNGTIEPFDSGNHESWRRHDFSSPDEQRELLADKAKGKAKAEFTDPKGDK